MNRRPLWKHALVALALLAAGFYALPSVYPDSPVVQVRGAGREVDSATVAAVAKALSQAEISASVELKDGIVQARFADGESQIAGRRAIENTLGRGYVAALNTATTAPQWLEIAGASPIALGLDLRGGVHFLLQVDVDFAEQKYLDGLAAAVREKLRADKVRYRSVKRERKRLAITLRDSSSKAKANESLVEFAADLQPLESEVDSPILLLEITEEARDELAELALNQNLETLRNRVDELGVAEPVIARQGKDRIVAQLPGVQDTARAKAILGRTAALELRGVDERASRSSAAIAAARKRPPANAELFESRDGEPLLLERKIVVTGEYITDARPGFDNEGNPAVHLSLNAAGANDIKRYTRNRVGEQLAILLIEKDFSEIISAPVIREELHANFIIHGSMTSAEANELSLLLRAGSLAAPLEIIEERTVGPSLGADNIRRGLNSVTGGFIAVAFFIAIYYAVFGGVSVASLLANLICLTAMLAALRATLTLPGLAGFALTLGMAIDANVLINERVREELNSGRTPLLAIDAGYARAFATILDANVTTLIAGLALFAFGSGPVRGFAVVLCLGLLTSMFSAITVSRGLVDLIYFRRRVRPSTISIG